MDFESVTDRNKGGRKVYQGYDGDDSHDNSFTFEVPVELLSSFGGLTLQMLQDKLFPVAYDVRQQPCSSDLHFKVVDNAIELRKERDKFIFTRIP